MSSFAAPPAAIDRIAPTRRPDDRVVMRQNWNDLLFLHWCVPIEQLRPLIPEELEIDTFEGRAYVGLVAFTMTGVRPVWSPSVPPLSNFHETNVRTYVHYQGTNPGVWFFSLDAANAVAVRIARALWRLPYFYARMRLQRTAAPVPVSAESTLKESSAAAYMQVDYTTERLWPRPMPASCSVRYLPSGQPAPAEVGTLEHFLAERYLLYTCDDRQRLYCGQVNHLPYPLQTASVLSLEENMISAAGIHRGHEAPLVHYARGVAVDVFPLRPVRH